MTAYHSWAVRAWTQYWISVAYAYARVWAPVLAPARPQEGGGR